MNEESEITSPDSSFILHHSGFVWSFRAMLKQQLLILTRYPVNLVANFLLVLLTVIVVTFSVTLFAPAALEARLRGMALYGFLIYIFLSHTIWTAGLSIYREQVEGTLESFYLSPASRFLTLLARSLVTLVWTSSAGLLGLLLAQLVTGPLALHNPTLALTILLFTISGLTGLAFAIAGLALRFGETMELLANLVEFGLVGLCAFFFPFSILPDSLQTISRFIPLSYAVDAFRTVALGHSQPELLPLGAELTIVIITGLLGPPLGYLIYHLNERAVRRQGTL
jgi:ABC-2 type transport system permease protein